MVIIDYRNSAPENKIADLSEQIIRDQGPGVLNWMLEGLDKLSAAHFQLELTANQQGRVNDLLLESDSVRVFVENCLERDGTETLTVADCFAHYVEYCGDRGWIAVTKNRFGATVADAVARKHSLSQRNDIRDTHGKNQRGWNGLRFKGNP